MSPATQPFNHRVKKEKQKNCSVGSGGNPQALRSHPESLSCLEWALKGSPNLPLHLSDLWRRQAAGPLSPCDGAVIQLSRRAQRAQLTTPSTDHEGQERRRDPLQSGRDLALTDDDVPDYLKIKTISKTTDLGKIFALPITKGYLAVFQIQK